MKKSLRRGQGIVNDNKLNIFKLIVLILIIGRIDSYSQQNTNIKIEVKNIDCFGGGNGKITITNLTPTSFEFKIQNTGTATVVSDWGPNLSYNIPKGKYEVKSRDPGNAIAEFTDLIEIIEPAALKITGINVINQPTTSISNDGQIQIDIQGGLSPYNVNFVDGAGNTKYINPFSGLLAGISKGNLVFQIKDAANCGPVIGSKIITSTASYDLDTEIKSITCSGNGFTPGEIKLTFAGGSGNYTINFGTGVKVVNAPGIYRIPLNEAIKYKITFSDGINLTEIPIDFSSVKCKLVVNSRVIKDATTNDPDAGTVRIVVADGTQPYNCDIISSNTGNIIQTRKNIQTSTFDFVGLKEGSYVAKVNDSFGAHGESSEIVVAVFKLSGSEVRTQIDKQLDAFFPALCQVSIKRRRIENAKKITGYLTTGLGMAGAYLTAGATQVASLALSFFGQIYSQENGGENGNIAKCDNALKAADIFLDRLKKYNEDATYFDTWDNIKADAYKDDFRSLMSTIPILNNAPKTSLSTDKLRRKFPGYSSHIK